MVISSRRQHFPKDPTEQRVQAFKQRYGQQATHLAAHAAFPLTLTTDVVYCLRETFLPECPWYASADILLSGLCTPAGHDLYEMEAATRRYLLRYLRDQFTENRIKDLEHFMVAYLRHRLTTEDSDRSLILGEKPHWTALACLRPGKAFDEIRQTLEQLALGEVDSADRFRLASLVESYGDFLADRGYQPMLLDMADRVAEGEPVDATAELASDLKTAGFTVSLVDFEIATVTFGGAVAEVQEADLKSFDFRTVTVNDQGEEVHTETGQAFYFEEVLAENVHSLKLMAIPSGEFMMGSPEDEPGRYSDESPQHLVKVSPFFMGQTPVTQAQWRVVAALPEQEHDLNPDPARFKGDERPVEQVSWYEAVEFCARLSEHTGRTYRLPTEAEWEYACRADTATPFSFGPTITTELASYDGSVYLNEPEGNSRDETTPVGQFPPNAFGLYDMHGNLWEWCQDHWPESESYEGAPSDGSAWISENKDARRINRGGSWDFNPRNCRSACRNNNNPGFRYVVIGFRVVCEARSR
ncbi:MAG: formylglycine-generating enzyme family protein [Leptolyngbya sp. SIO1E4]|nr:formylglycine-generating enzyme family protein [Leptolyngbya sp. SIO1E4]